NEVASFFAQMNFPADFDTLKRAMSEVECDVPGSITFPEFRKMMMENKLRRTEVEEVKAAIHTLVKLTPCLQTHDTRRVNVDTLLTQMSRWDRLPIEEIAPAKATLTNKSDGASSHASVVDIDRTLDTFWK
ncbi:hypothetical protein KIPB_009567, partial [Kipferlia bialata]